VSAGRRLFLGSQNRFRSEARSWDEGRDRLERKQKSPQLTMPLLRAARCNVQPERLSDGGKSGQRGRCLLLSTRNRRYTVLAVGLASKKQYRRKAGDRNGVLVPKERDVANLH
jgi:hypothetical protein